MSDSRAISSIVVPLKTDVRPFTKGLDEATKHADKATRGIHGHFTLMGRGIGNTITNITGKLETLGKSNVGMVATGLAGVAAAAIAAATAVASIGFANIKQIGKDALAIGTTADEFSRLRMAAKMTGTDVEAMSGFVKGLNQSINESIGKTTTASEAFKMLGLSAEELSKMTAEQRVMALVRAFELIPDEARKAEIAMRLQEETGVDAMKILAMGSQELQRAMAAAPIVEDKDVSEIRKLEIALNKIGTIIEDLGNKFTLYVIPKLTTVLDLVLQVADKFGSMFGIKVAAPISVPGVPKFNTPAPAKTEAKPPAPNPYMQRQQSAREKEARDAQERADKLKAQLDKSRQDLGNHKATKIPNRANTGMVVNPEYRALHKHHATVEQQYNEAQKEADAKARLAKTSARAQADAKNINIGMLKEVAALKQEYRSINETAGQDEIHRRVNAIKGISDNDRKALIQQGYQAREANKTTALRDELHESLKMPQEKLAEDINRINKLVQLGADNGGISRRQGILAIAQKTEESGLGEAPRYSGVASSYSDDGRSYLLSQMGIAQDPLSIAKRGVELAGVSAGFLSRIANAVENGRDTTYAMN